MVRLLTSKKTTRLRRPARRAASTLEMRSPVYSTIRVPFVMSQIANAPRPAIGERLMTQYFLDDDTSFLSYRPHEVVSHGRTSSCRSRSLPLCIADGLRKEGPPAKRDSEKEHEEIVNSC